MREHDFSTSWKQDIKPSLKRKIKVDCNLSLFAADKVSYGTYCWFKQRLPTAVRSCQPQSGFSNAGGFTFIATGKSVNTQTLFIFVGKPFFADLLPRRHLFQISVSLFGIKSAFQL